MTKAKELLSLMESDEAELDKVQKEIMSLESQIHIMKSAQSKWKKPETQAKVKEIKAQIRKLKPKYDELYRKVNPSKGGDDNGASAYFNSTQYKNRASK